MHSQRTCQACSLDEGSLGFLSHSLTPFICFSSWSSLNLSTLNCWWDHKISCLWERLSLTLFSLVSFVTPSSWAPSWPNCLGQGPFLSRCTADLDSTLTASQGFVEAGNEYQEVASEASWPLGTFVTSLPSTPPCSATTYVKGLNKSLKFSSFNLPGFNIGLWRVVGHGLFLSDAWLRSFSLHLSPVCSPLSSSPWWLSLIDCAPFPQSQTSPRDLS